MYNLNPLSGNFLGQQQTQTALPFSTYVPGSGYVAGKQPTVQGTNTQTNQTRSGLSAPIPVSSQTSQGDNVQSLQDQQMAEINRLSDILNPLYAQLEGNAQSQADQSKSEVTTQIGNEKADLQSAYEQAMKNVQGQRNDTEVNKVNSLNGLNRSQNQLQQKYMAQFGGGSSAGSASREIVDQAYAQNRGSLESGYLGALQKIGEMQFQVDQQHQSLVKKADDALIAAVGQINEQFKARMSEIAGMRAETEQNKSAMKLQAITERVNQAQAAKAEQLQFLRELQFWKLQQDGDIKSALSYNADQINSMGQNVFAQNQNVAQAGQGLNSLGSNQASASTPYNYLNPAQTQKKDEFNSLYPFA